MKAFGVRVFSLFFWGIVVIIFQAQSQLPSRTPEQIEAWQRDHEEKLEEKRRVEKQRNLVAQKEQGILQKLQQIEAELAANKREIARYEKQIKHHQLKVDELQVELEQLRAQDKDCRRLAAKRIRAIYKVGYNGRQLQMVKILLGAENLTDFLQRYKYMSFIAESDQALLELLQTQREQIVRTRSDLVQRIQTIVTASKVVETKQNHIVAQKQEREQLLHQYRTQKAIYNQTLKELRAAVTELENLLGIVTDERITDQAQEMGSIQPDLLGKLPWPVIGKIVQNQTSADRGISIQAEKGAPVTCVADGVVAKTEHIVGYGNTVLVTHGKGYISVYAHLSDVHVKRGEPVRMNQVIGQVGETGSLIGDVLYFELWHNYARLNTEEWLRRHP